MRRVFPFIAPQRAITVRFSAGNPPNNPPNNPPPPSGQSSQQSSNTNNNNQRQGNGRSILIGAIIALIVLMLIACVALAPGFLGGRQTGQTSTTPSPAIATTPSPTVAPSPSPTTPTMAPGLVGSYYRMPTYLPGQPVTAMPTGTPVFTAVDPNIDVPHGLWGANGTQHYPHPELGNLGPHGFAIRWDGLIQPSETATFTFYTVSDDGVRVWVNQRLLIDNWTSHAPSANCSDVAAPGTPNPAPATGCSTIQLTANQLYSVRVEYYENNVDGAQIQLFWQAPDMSHRQIVPASAFFHKP